MLGRKIRDCAKGMGFLARLQHRWRQVRGQAEIQKNDATCTRHEHVVRFDIAVQDAGAMQRCDTLGELAQRSA